MKKSKCFGRAAKFALFLSGLLGIPAAINHMIFKRANKKSKIRIAESYYEWRHGNIRYIVVGSGRPLLLLHSMTPGSGIHEWEKTIYALSRHYKVYAPDMLGFGYSDKPGLAYSSYLFITFINDFIQNVIGEKVLVAAAGTSGAYAVMAYTFHPELYRKMLLASPELAHKATDRKHNLAGKLMELPILGTAFYNVMTSKLGIRWYLKKRLLCENGNLATIVNQYYYAAHFGGANAKYPIAACLSGLLSVHAEDRLTQVKIPVHIIQDGDIPDTCGLLPHIEAPKAFYKICRRFYR